MFAKELSDVGEALLFSRAAKLLSIWVVGEDALVPELGAFFASGLRSVLSYADFVGRSRLEVARDLL